METSLRPKKRPKETSLRPKIRPTKRPKLRPSEEEMANIEVGRTIRRANRLKKLIEKEAVGLYDDTPLVPIMPPTSEPVKGTSRKRFGSRSRGGVKKRPHQQFELGGDVRHNPNRGKTY